MECLRKQIDEGIIDVPENYQADLTPVLDAIDAITAIPAADLMPVLDAIAAISGTDLTPVLTAIAAITDVNLPEVLSEVRKIGRGTDEIEGGDPFRVQGSNFSGTADGLPDGTAEHDLKYV